MRFRHQQWPWRCRRDRTELVCIFASVASTVYITDRQCKSLARHRRLPGNIPLRPDFEWLASAGQSDSQAPAGCPDPAAIFRDSRPRSWRGTSCFLVRLRDLVNYLPPAKALSAGAAAGSAPRRTRGRAGCPEWIGGRTWRVVSLASKHAVLLR